MARELSSLEHAARRLLEDFGAGKNLTESANGLREALEASTTEPDNADAYRDAARRLHHKDGETEVDDGAQVSASEGGAYVAAWLWIEDGELCTCCRHWRSACASERQHGGASACRDTTCEGCGGDD